MVKSPPQNMVKWFYKYGLGSKYGIWEQKSILFPDFNRDFSGIQNLKNNGGRNDHEEGQANPGAAQGDRIPPPRGNKSETVQTPTPQTGNG